MDALLENGQKAIPGSLLVTTLRQPTESMEPYSWEVFAVRNVTSVINPELLALNLRGIKLNDALTFIHEQPGVSRESEIKNFPKWWQQMPFLSFRITVVTP